MTPPQSDRTAAQTGWPTTLRYSRRLGETVRGAEYACAIERPSVHRNWLDVMLGWGLRMRPGRRSHADL